MLKIQNVVHWMYDSDYVFKERWLKELQIVNVEHVMNAQMWWEIQSIIVFAYALQNCIWDIP